MQTSQNLHIRNSLRIHVISDQINNVHWFTRFFQDHKTVSFNIFLHHRYLMSAKIVKLMQISVARPWPQLNASRLVT